MFLLQWLCIYSSGPTINRDLNSAKMHFVPNLEILAWISGDLSGARAQNGANFDF